MRRGPTSLRSKLEGTRVASTPLPDDYSELVPPDPIPNSAVKRLSADGSVGFPHVRVGHRQVLSQGPIVSSVGPF